MENKSNVPGFFVACRNADIATAKDLLKRVNPSSLSTTWEGRTCFHVAVIAGDADLLQELATELRVSGSDLNNIIRKTDKKGDTALHLAVRKNRVDLLTLLVSQLDANLCDCENKRGETPLKLAISLGFKDAVEFLITRTSNALHMVVELNQVKLVQFLMKKNVDLSKLINQHYQQTTNPPDKENCATNAQHVVGGDQHRKEKGPANESGDGGEESLESNGDTNNQEDQPIVLIGDTPLHIAARNKFEHMVNLLLKVPGVNKLAQNSESKTPFEIAREVMEYHESFRTIRKLAYSRGRPKSFMDCSPQVTHEKLLDARKRVGEAYKARREAELVVAALLAAMTCAAAFTVPGSFESSKDAQDRGSPNLISLTSFKLFLIFDCIAFFLSLFVCIMWEMSTELTTGDKMLFMTVNSFVVCCSFGFTAYGFMAAVYVMLVHKVKTLSWVILGILIAINLWGVIAFLHQSVQFAVKRARFHRLCGVSCFYDEIVEKLWSRIEHSGLLDLVRSGDEVSQDLITGHAMCCGLLNFVRSDDDASRGIISRSIPALEVSYNNSPFSSPLNPSSYNYSRSSSPFLNHV